MPYHVVNVALLAGVQLWLTAASVEFVQLGPSHWRGPNAVESPRVRNLRQTADSLAHMTQASAAAWDTVDGETNRTMARLNQVAVGVQRGRATVSQLQPALNSDGARLPENSTVQGAAISQHGRFAIGQHVRQNESFEREAESLLNQTHNQDAAAARHAEIGQEAGRFAGSAAGEIKVLGNAILKASDPNSSPSAELISALVANMVTVIAIFTAVHILRRRYPQVYENNVAEGSAPFKPGSGFWGWARASFSVTLSQTNSSAGLDQALMLEFCFICMKILAIIGIPMFVIMGPINCFFGGNPAGEEDYLACSSYENIQNGSTLHWLYALIVWGVVLVVDVSVCDAQKKFLELRFDWLASLPAIRSNTLLVEGIPDEYRSDARLKEFFEKMIPGSTVKGAHVVKDTGQLQVFIAQEKALKDALHRAEHTWHAAGSKEDDRPMMRPSLLSPRVDAIQHYTEELATVKEQIENERSRLMDLAAQVGGVNLSNGFVTFEHRYDAEICLNLKVTHDSSEWSLSTPPPPTDVLWSDLSQNRGAQHTRTLVGYALVVGLFFAYMPLVIGITNVAHWIDAGPLQPVWAGLAPSIGLQIMVSFLPTLLLLIFRSFFTLRADAFAQHKLQVWYYWFQIFFVILAAAVGQDVKHFLKTLVRQPLAVFGVMANTMPAATHFYLNYLVLQWASECALLIRIVPLMKFIFFNAIYDEKNAKEMSEPEDQDFDGIGARSARLMIDMAVGIVYGTLDPTVNIMGIANFAATRLVFGYLVPFAETRKPDLGGRFWVSMLKSLFFSTMIYCILMIGVLAERANSWGPMLIASPSLLYVVWSWGRFDALYAWKQLPHMQVIEEITKPDSHREAVGSYMQPELEQHSAQAELEHQNAQP